MIRSKSLSFSSKIKKEVLINAKKPLENFYLIKGLVFSNASEGDEFYELNIKNEYIKSKIIAKLQKLNLNFISDQKWKYKILIPKKTFDFNEKIVDNEYLTFFFAGVFLGSGSISNKESTSYHLEISSLSQEKSYLIQKKLNSYEFSFHIIKKQQRYVLYIKKIDELLDFLSAIGAKKSWFELQNLKIVRDKENVLNRINNIDFSNLQKIANSSIKHIDNINYIFENNLMDYFNDDQLMFFRLKIENPWLSLNDLVRMQIQQSNTVVSKSGANHWLRKLDKIVKEHKK
ncbi:DNA-binding protein WhiA [Mycoplasmopsis cynos]|uniref:DNA-binding protein WhiA n=1 Tax=Mycoplasmopsis cynos TaxID=171284 RepID=UPI00220736BD|nr:DNA-binding protein WhiA [Mycoplasmopsis cynos]UWV82021.1 DNA-binding protein WhiA [Mycoplasmopsis cynos]WAM04743.1 DNA-binding protein WhiA [Mycoplasmopsis cynos]